MDPFMFFKFSQFYDNKGHLSSGNNLCREHWSKDSEHKLTKKQLKHNLNKYKPRACLYDPATIALFPFRIPSAKLFGYFMARRIQNLLCLISCDIVTI